jgi:hypothetical protein
MKDRFDGSGGMFTKEALVENRSWCLSQIRLFYTFLEKLLADGREWILGGSSPSLAELHAGWVYDWGLGMADPSHESMADAAKVLRKEEFPKTHTWVQRWRDVTAEAEKSNPGAGSMDEGKEAEERVVKAILAGSFVEPNDLQFDADDIMGFKKGQKISVAPTDFGFMYEDRGSIVGLSKEEVVIEVDVPGGKDGKLRLHYPRVNFKLIAVD